MGTAALDPLIAEYRVHRLRRLREERLCREAELSFGLAIRTCVERVSLLLDEDLRACVLDDFFVGTF